jgi:hypothetical protein
MQISVALPLTAVSSLLVLDLFPRNRPSPSLNYRLLAVWDAGRRLFSTRFACSLNGWKVELNESQKQLTLLS